MDAFTAINKIRELHPDFNEMDWDGKTATFHNENGEPFERQEFEAKSETRKNWLELEDYLSSWMIKPFNMMWDNKNENN